MKGPSVSSDYQAEDDARTLMRAEEVRGDNGRLGKAAKAVKKLEAEAQRTLLHAKVVKGMKRAFKS